MKRKFLLLAGITLMLCGIVSAQAKLVEKAESNPKYISEVDRGRVNISMDALIKISEALNVQLLRPHSRHLVFRLLHRSQVCATTRVA